MRRTFRLFIFVTIFFLTANPRMKVFADQTGLILKIKQNYSVIICDAGLAEEKKAAPPDRGELENKYIARLIEILVHYKAKKLPDIFLFYPDNDRFLEKGRPIVHKIICNKPTGVSLLKRGWHFSPLYSDKDKSLILKKGAADAVATNNIALIDELKPNFPKSITFHLRKSSLENPSISILE